MAPIVSILKTKAAASQVTTSIRSSLTIADSTSGMLIRKLILMARCGLYPRKSRGEMINPCRPRTGKAAKAWTTLTMMASLIRAVSLVPENLGVYFCTRLVNIRKSPTTTTIILLGMSSCFRLIKRSEAPIAAARTVEMMRKGIQLIPLDRLTASQFSRVLWWVVWQCGDVFSETYRRGDDRTGLQPK